MSKFLEDLSPTRSVTRYEQKKSKIRSATMGWRPAQNLVLSRFEQVGSNGIWTLTNKITATKAVS